MVRGWTSETMKLEKQLGPGPLRTRTWPGIEETSSSTGQEWATATLPARQKKGASRRVGRSLRVKMQIAMEVQLSHHSHKA